MLRRNDKCYCGSGKKYKNCCMEKDLERERLERRYKIVEDAQARYAEIYIKIAEFAKEERFDEYRQSAAELFYILDTETVRTKFEKFFNTYFISDCIFEGKTITQIYAEENKLSEKELRIMNSLIGSFVSIYTIHKKEANKVILRDCFLGEEIATEDVKLLKDFEEGDNIIARSVEVNGVRILIDITVKIVDSTRDFMIEDIERLYEQNKEDIPDKKLFLIWHTYVFYRYLQQLLDEEVSNYVRETLLAREENTVEVKETKEVVEDDGSVLSIISKLADEDCKEKCIGFWKEYEAAHEGIKGSEKGWAAAVEYVIKKENGISVTQLQIAEKYEISASTLGKRAKELKA